MNKWIRRVAVLALAGLMIPVAGAAVFHSTFQPNTAIGEPVDKGCVGNVGAGYACVAQGNSFSLEAWTVYSTGGAIDWAQTLWAPAVAGGNSVDLNANFQTNPGVLVAGFSGLTVGNVYVVTLMYSGNPGDNIGEGTNNKNFTAFVSSQSTSAIWGQQSFSFDAERTAVPNLIYDTGTFIFTAGATSGAIWLQSDTAGAYGSVIGMVDISDVGGVPEPATYAMMGAGLAALAFARRRK